jgi:hypothetical protein
VSYETVRRWARILGEFKRAWHYAAAVPGAVVRSVEAGRTGPLGMQINYPRFVPLCPYARPVRSKLSMCFLARVIKT